MLLILDLFIWLLLNVMLRCFFFSPMIYWKLKISVLLVISETTPADVELFFSPCLQPSVFMYIEFYCQCLPAVVLKQHKQLWSVNNNSGLHRVTECKRPLRWQSPTINTTKSTTGHWVNWVVNHPVNWVSEPPSGSLGEPLPWTSCSSPPPLL